MDSSSPQNKRPAFTARRTAANEDLKRYPVRLHATFVRLPRPNTATATAWLPSSRG